MDEMKGEIFMMEVKIKGIYKHFKGDYYILEDIATHSETDEEYVVYRPLYGDTNRLYVRPYDMFFSEVDSEKYPYVEQTYRFELQDIKSVKWLVYIYLKLCYNIVEQNILILAIWTQHTYDLQQEVRHGHVD